jgi:2-polyprenyl-3-methyl-5-hydroxy-6-metoxy-1,4-benzoquinol methylase
MGQEKEWDKIWKNRKTPLMITIDIGREIYNIFFRLFLKKYLNEKTEMIELGSGTSSLGISIAPKIKSYTGIDISNEALKLAKNLAKKENVKNTFFEIDDCTDLKTKKKYDLVWSQGLIEHFDKPKDIVVQHVKVCKKGGYCVISVPYKYSYMVPWYWITRPKFLRGLWPWTEQIFFSKKDLKKIGIEIKKPFKVKLIQPFFFGVVALIIKNE